jgi:hypothetical protein
MYLEDIMPVSKKHAQKADLRTQAAAKMQIDIECVFVLPALSKTRSKPVLAIWTEGWSEEEIKRVRALKPEVKAIATAAGAKLYLTSIHPHEQNAREARRERARAQNYRDRQREKRLLPRNYEYVCTYRHEFAVVQKPSDVPVTECIVEKCNGACRRKGR